MNHLKPTTVNVTATDSSTPNKNWANRTKTATTAIPLSKPTTERGTRHNGVLEAFTPKSYKTGSFGVELKYTIEGLERPVYENVVLTTQTKEGPNRGKQEATKYGLASLKRRLQAFGLNSTAISAFPIPVLPNEENGAYDLQGAPVVVYLIDEDYMGRPQKRVKAVYPIDG